MHDVNAEIAKFVDYACKNDNFIIDGKVIIPHFPAGYNGFVEGHAGELFRGRKKTFGEKEDFSKFFGIVYCTKIGLPERGGGREALHAVQRSVFG